MTSERIPTPAEQAARDMIAKFTEGRIRVEKEQAARQQAQLDQQAKILVAARDVIDARLGECEAKKKVLSTGQALSSALEGLHLTDAERKMIEGGSMPAEEASSADEKNLQKAIRASLELSKPVDFWQPVLETKVATLDVLNEYATELPGIFHEDGKTVTIAGERYVERDVGQKHEEHSNLCFYLCATNGNGEAAVALKKTLAPIGNMLIGGIAGRDFRGPNTSADSEIVVAFMRHSGRQVLVASRASKKALLYGGPSKAPILRLHLRGGHYTLLER